MEIYKVGGCVRDELLGITPKDIDYVVVGSSEEEMLSLGYKKVGADFPIFLDEKNEEYALARIERKVAAGYHGFTVETKDVTLKDDLYRRDLTINAIAKDKDGKIIDPFNGMADLKHKILNPLSNAFIEDPVRILRLARFKARFPDFTIHIKAYTMAKEVKPELSSLTPERVWKEMEKALTEEKPSHFFRTLNNLNVLDVLFPEIYNMTHYMHGGAKYHAEGSVFEHSMRVLDEAAKLSKDPKVRFAALFHDIGKPYVCELRNNFFGHEDRSVVEPLFDALQKKYRIPNDYIQLALSSSISHHKLHKIEELKPNTIVKMFEDKYLMNHLEDCLKVVQADSNGRVYTENVNAPFLNLQDLNMIFDNKKPTYNSVNFPLKSNEYLIHDFLYCKGQSEHNINLILEIRDAIKSVKVGEWIASQEKEPSVEAIKTHILQEKIKAIKAVFRKYTKDPANENPSENEKDIKEDIQLPPLLLRNKRTD